MKARAKVYYGCKNVVSINYEVITVIQSIMPNPKSVSHPASKLFTNFFSLRALKKEYALGKLALLPGLRQTNWRYYVFALLGR